MTVKQLLMLIFKSIGFLLVVPNIIYMPSTMYATIQSYKMYGDDPGTPALFR
jgi:hypothetical protein